MTHQCGGADGKSSEPRIKALRSLRHSQKAGPTLGDQGENGSQKWFLGQY